MSDDAVGREIKQLRESLKEGIADLHADIGRLVSRDVHDEQLGRLGDRVSTVERDLDRLVTAIAEDRRLNEERRRTAEDRAAAGRRILWGALLAAGLSIVMDVLRSTGAMP